VVLPKTIQTPHIQYPNRALPSGGMGSSSQFHSIGSRPPSVLIIDDDEYVHGALEAALAVRSGSAAAPPLAALRAGYPALLRAASDAERRG